jgi:hypothetical protein
MRRTAIRTGKLHTDRALLVCLCPNSSGSRAQIFRPANSIACLEKRGGFVCLCGIFLFIDRYIGTYIGRYIVTGSVEGLTASVFSRPAARGIPTYSEG